MLDDLLEAVRTVKEGSQEMDVTLAYLLGFGEPSMRQAYEKFGPTAFQKQWVKDKHGRREIGRSEYEKMRFGFQEAVLFVGEDNRLVRTPKFTTSLDAKLPGEEIIEVRRMDGQWLAICLCTSDVSGQVGFRAHTEALARRGAALMAMKMEREKE